MIPTLIHNWDLVWAEPMWEKVLLLIVLVLANVQVILAVFPSLTFNRPKTMAIIRIVCIPLVLIILSVFVARAGLAYRTPGPFWIWVILWIIFVAYIFVATAWRLATLFSKPKPSS
jgi:hypothetical protein